MKAEKAKEARGKTVIHIFRLETSAQGPREVTHYFQLSAYQARSWIIMN